VAIFALINERMVVALVFRIIGWILCDMIAALAVRADLWMAEVARHGVMRDGRSEARREEMQINSAPP
jgi:hypothetical protein